MSERYVLNGKDAIIRNNPKRSRAWTRLRPNLKPPVLAALISDDEFCGARPGSERETRAFERVVRKVKRRI